MSRRLFNAAFKNCFLLLYINHKLKKFIKNPNINFDDKFAFSVKYLKKYHKDMHVNVKYYGLENIISKDVGCMFIGNHQGRNDCLTVLQGLEKHPSSFVVDDKRSHMFLFGNICDAFRAKRICFDDLRSQLKVYNEMTLELQHGKSFVLFPEAGYKDNKNTLLEFNTACFKPIIKSKCPIVPFVLYDSWKVFGTKGTKPVDVRCYFLPAIYYEEYKDMDKACLASYVKSKIQAKLDEIESQGDE